ncbi:MULTISPECIES: hypothetical protein [unclassified Leclercia]|uniref:Phage protein n=1 Tax=Leclercia barmai TaxID=2785629 RepID=A0ABS7RT26_9ENTR|nr:MULTISPECIES: hypothetical protein [unclassified Leclercia]MBZ0057463.1 hypothetical protein [Leclercia sp. EMC7]MCM5695627.1 hypothetical protein [Leclercia sp. LTM01]MCM5700035.1 hypothetical protein [Leclercia sp. LTM14]
MRDSIKAIVAEWLYYDTDTQRLHWKETVKPSTMAYVQASQQTENDVRYVVQTIAGSFDEGELIPLVEVSRTAERKRAMFMKDHAGRFDRQPVKRGQLSYFKAGAYGR